MVGHRISFSDNLQKLKFSGLFVDLCVAMVTDMTSQVPSKYSPAIELQGDKVFPLHQISFFVSSIVSQTLQQRKTLSSILKIVMNGCMCLLFLRVLDLTSLRYKQASSSTNLINFPSVSTQTLVFSHCHFLELDGYRVNIFF